MDIRIIVLLYYLDHFHVNLMQAAHYIDAVSFITTLDCILFCMLGVKILDHYQSPSSVFSHLTQGISKQGLPIYIKYL